MENGTRQLVEQGSHFFSYMREVELVLNKLYTDLGEILFSIELASMNKLAVFLFSPKKKKTHVHFVEYFNPFRTRS